MSEAEQIERLVKILRAVPPKRLLLIELANPIPLVNGNFDYLILADKKTEINLAIAEATAYGGFTLQAVDDLVRLKAVSEKCGT